MSTPHPTLNIRLPAPVFRCEIKADDLASQLLSGGMPVYLKHLEVRNFRALEKVEATFGKRLNVIVGPNAVGKTTILEAIRLARAVLAPRIPNETSQSLIQLGAMVPHNTQTVIASAIARDLDKEIVINTKYQLENNEIEDIKSSKQQILTSVVVSRLGMQNNPSGFAQFTSSPDAKKVFDQVSDEFDAFFSKSEAGGNTFDINLVIDFKRNRMAGADPMAGPCLAYLEARNPPGLTTFTYFPADRSLPRGETPVQLGLVDAQQLIESHNTNPQAKYARLKTTFFNAMIINDESRVALTDEFNRVFTGLLKGKKLGTPGVNEHGQLNIRVIDINSQREFDIDAMSSGEKELILTFLLLDRSLVRGAIFMLDEPEMHLNPAVCKELLPTLIDGYASRKNLQGIICSHSPELVASAFDRDECELFHLESERLISRVEKKTHEEVTGILRRLGTSESEDLLYKGTIFVEGFDDADIIEEGFQHIVGKHKIVDMGGRSEIEKTIAELQQSERDGYKFSKKYFIFDNDGRPVEIPNSDKIKILQWKRYCIENYLLDVECISKLVTDEEICRKPFPSVQEARRGLRELAFSQIEEISVRKVYEKKGYSGVGLLGSDFQMGNFESVGNAIASRIEKAVDYMKTFNREDWSRSFIVECERTASDLRAHWQDQWVQECNGKRLFSDLGRAVVLKMKMATFKRRVLVYMGAAKPPSDSFTSLEGAIRGLIES